jgi:hypothetical protein
MKTTFFILFYDLKILGEVSCSSITAATVKLCLPVYTLYLHCPKGFGNFFYIMDEVKTI